MSLYDHAPYVGATYQDEGQRARDAMSIMAGLSNPKSRPDFDQLVERLREKMLSARQLESEIGHIAYRLGGSAPTAETRCDPGNASAQIQPPLIIELNNLVDDLAGTLLGIGAEISRIRAMVG